MKFPGILMVAFLVPHLCFALMGERPLLTKKLDQGQCYEFKDKVIFVLSKETGGPPAVSIGVTKLEGKRDFGHACTGAKQKLILNDIENSRFEGTWKDLALLSRFMSAPGTGSLSIYSLTDGKRKISVSTGDEETTLVNGKLTFFQPKESFSQDEEPTRWKEIGCKDEWGEGALGCTLLIKSILDLRTFKITETSERKIAPAQ